MENIDILNKTILETTDSIDIAQTDQNLSVNDMFQQSSVESLAKKICAVLPLSGPSGALFNIKKKTGTRDFAIVRKEVGIYANELVKTGLTQEVVQDVKAIYGKETPNIIGKLLRGVANDIENAALIDFLDEKSKDYGDLTLTDSNSAETNLSEILQKINEIILKMNQKSYRTYESFAVLPLNALASIYAFGKLLSHNENIDERGLFVTQIASTKFYLNPNSDDTNVYVGLMDSENPGRCSVTFSPYQQQVVEVEDYDSGNIVYFLINRFAITESPLHETNKEMLYKFKIVI